MFPHLFIYLTFSWLCDMACRILVPRPGIKLMQWKFRVPDQGSNSCSGSSESHLILYFWYLWNVLNVSPLLWSKSIILKIIKTKYLKASNGLKQENSSLAKNTYSNLSLTPHKVFIITRMKVLNHFF